VIGDIVAIVMNEELLELGQEERFRQLNLPIGLGDEKRKYFYFGKIASIDRIELKPPPREEETGDTIKTSIPWEKEALKALQAVPSAIREMIVEMAEDIVKNEGAYTVTHERYMKSVEEYAPNNVMERFEQD